MRLSPIALVTALMLAAATPAAAEIFRFVAMGDLPYTKTGDYSRFDRLAVEVNSRRPAFSIHVGDIKSGSSPCTDTAFLAIRDRFDHFDAPLFYTPGDNEWTDCHRRKAGDFDPHERLARLRALFFPQAMSFGRHPRAYVRQSDTGVHVQMVENAIWLQGEVLFATIHVVGSNNGRKARVAHMLEFQQRDAANADWIATAFNEAKGLESQALVLAFHANPDFDGGIFSRPDESGFTGTLAALAKAATDFGKPVLLIHGDTHDLTIDQPLKGPDGAVLKNVTRLEVYGAPQVGAVEVTVDARRGNKTFTFDPFTVD